MKFIKAFWFGKIGIVVGEDVITKEKKAYMGLGEGHDEGLDVGTIMEKGTKVHLNILEEIVKELK